MRRYRQTSGVFLQPQHRMNHLEDHAWTLAWDDICQLCVLWAVWMREGHKPL